MFILQLSVQVPIALLIAIPLCMTERIILIRLFIITSFRFQAILKAFSISNYKGKLRLFASVSYGRNETKGIYCSYLYTYVFDESNGNKTLDNILACPPMLELTYAQGGKLYCLFESAAYEYRDVSRKPLSCIVPLKMSLLCDEKKGSFVNINVSNVANGKKYVSIVIFQTAKFITVRLCLITVKVKLHLVMLITKRI